MKTEKLNLIKKLKNIIILKYSLFFILLISFAISFYIPVILLVCLCLLILENFYIIPLCEKRRFLLLEYERKIQKERTIFIGEKIYQHFINHEFKEGTDLLIKFYKKFSIHELVFLCTIRTSLILNISKDNEEQKNIHMEDMDSIFKNTFGKN